MVLNYINTVFYTVTVFLVVNYSKVNAEESKSQVVNQIVQNITRVNNLLESFIKHVEKVEGTSGVIDQSAAVTEDADIFNAHHEGKHENNKTKHGDNNDDLTLNFKTRSKSVEMRDSLSDIRYSRRGSRRANKDSGEKINIKITNFPKKNINEKHKSLKVNSDGEITITDSDLSQENRNKSSLSTEVNLDVKQDIKSGGTAVPPPSRARYTIPPTRYKNVSYTYLKVTVEDDNKYVFTDSPKKYQNETPTYLDVRKHFIDDKVSRSTHKSKHGQIQKYQMRASTLEEDNIMKDNISKLKILRQEVEDACKKVVMRKCTKALEKVLTDVCSKQRKCARKLKEDFSKNGDVGCNKEFNKKRPIYCRMGYDDEFEETADDSETDHKRTQLRTSKIKKLENKCKKSEYRKGLAACKYAVATTCEANSCSEELTKAFNKACATRNKQSFKVDEYDSSDTDSVSDMSVSW